MRVRIAILIVLAVLFTAVALLAIWWSAVWSVAANAIYGDGTNTTPPTLAQQAHASLLWAQSGAIAQLVTPFATASMLCVTGVLGVLAWRWELRGRAPAR